MIIADKGARIANILVDTILFFILFIIASAVTGMFSEVESSMGYLFFLFYAGYYFVFEYFLGRTPGKYLSGTKVVNRLGQKPGVKQMLIRSFARLIPYDYFSFIFGQGLHDSISGTAVVKCKNNKPTE